MADASCRRAAAAPDNPPELADGAGGTHAWRPCGAPVSIVTQTYIVTQIYILSHKWLCFINEQVNGILHTSSFLTEPPTKCSSTFTTLRITTNKVRVCECVCVRACVRLFVPARVRVCNQASTFAMLWLTSYTTFISKSSGACPNTLPNACLTRKVIEDRFTHA